MKTLAKLTLPLLVAAIAVTMPLPAQTASPAYNRSQQKGSHNTEQRGETLTGSDSDAAVARRRVYLSQDTKNRLAFVDIDQRTAGNDPSKPPYTDGNRVFISIAYGSPGWCELATKAQAAGGFATRAYTLNSESNWNTALRAAVNILATDKVRNHSWAKVGDAPIVPAPVPGKCGS